MVDQAKSGLAAEHDAVALRRLGEHVLEVVAPEVADQALGERLEKDEQRARQGTRLSMSDDGHGRTHLRAALPRGTSCDRRVQHRPGHR